MNPQVKSIKYSILINNNCTSSPEYFTNFTYVFDFIWLIDYLFLCKYSWHKNRHWVFKKNLHK